MYTFENHYKNILAKYYTRIFGGREYNQQKNSDLLSKFYIEAQDDSTALDLGCGSGFFSIPLGQKGFSVVAVDLDEILLDEINKSKGNLKVRTARDDILKFETHTSGVDFDVIVCMTDVISHFNSYEEIRALFEKIYKNLKSSGKFLLSYRDQSRDLSDTGRFIPFYSDHEIIVTTFLEQELETLNVTDIFYLKDGDKWKMLPSSYKKLRLFSSQIEKIAQQAGFEIIHNETENGLTYVLCIKS